MKSLRNYQPRRNASGQIVVAKYLVEIVVQGQNIPNVVDEPKLVIIGSLFSEEAWLFLSNANKSLFLLPEDEEVESDPSFEPRTNEEHDEDSNDEEVSSSDEAEEDDDEDSVSSQPMDQDAPDRSSGFAIYPCIEPACINVFRSLARRDEHIATKFHTYAPKNENLFDTAALAYKERSETVQTQPIVRLSVARAQSSAVVTTTSGNMTCLVPSYEGWALRDTNRQVRFTDDQRAYLAVIFQEGAASGQKWTPEAVEKVCMFLSYTTTFVYAT